MVNLNNSTKMMVNRCMELLNAKIAHAQTRHIAKRLPLTRINPRPLDTKALQHERQKTKKYEARKRLSMWEQDKDERQAGASNEDTRLDHAYYKHQSVNERDYDCTWNDFPEERKPKQKPNYIIEKDIPFNRRRSEERPETAKPWDAEAQDFIRQWDNNHSMINRNRYAKPPTVNSSMGKYLKKGVRGKMFYY